MKTLVIVGSRNREGQTARAVGAYSEGLREGGSDVETVFLTEMELSRCKQCDERGWGACRTRGVCGGHQDEFEDLVDKVRAADAVVFATPVYWGDLSESMRAFTDRLRRIASHGMRPEGLKGKKAAGICVAGGGGGGAPTCTVSLDNVLSTCGMDVVDLFPIRRQNLAYKLMLLHDAGKWLAAGAPAE